MADFVLKNNENVTLTIGAVDGLATPVAVTFDAGTVLVTVSDPGAVVATVSADETSVNIKALGPVIVGDVITVSGSVQGVALTPANFTVDVQPSAPVAITLTPGLATAN